MTDKPFDHEEYSRERLRQTTDIDGSDFNGHLVHRPGRIEADQQTIAHWKDETERWQEFATGYMRDLTAAEQAIAELRKALEVARQDFLLIQRDSEQEYDYLSDLSQDIYNDAVFALGRIDKALAAVAATDFIIIEEAGSISPEVRDYLRRRLPTLHHQHQQDDSGVDEASGTSDLGTRDVESEEDSHGEGIGDNQHQGGAGSVV